MTLDIPEVNPITTAYTGARFDSAVEGTGPVFLEQLNCGESDSPLLDCHSFSAAEPTTCDHSQDVSIQCTGTIQYMCGVLENLQLVYYSHCYTIIISCLYIFIKVYRCGLIHMQSLCFYYWYKGTFSDSCRY